MVAQPSMIKRPVLESAASCWWAFKPEDYEKAFGR